jgi:hypothetical protein
MAAANRNPDEIYRHQTGMIECTVIGMSARRHMPAHRATGYGVGEGSAGPAEVLYLLLAATTAA